MPRAKSPRTTKSATKAVADNKVLQMPENGKPHNSSHNGSSSSDLESAIRLRAYELYAQRGYLEGFEKEDWLTAEREVLARRAQSA
ncbi:MAG: hypothetical protein AUG89_00655 [Acidobacteria bacterium 13_1_20CM_4_56_7]|jgi:hypothetical protein|nr:MAG: hypothetical protein AUG89_00655 [Acidobacteria bacterium 13_1_20CM_4_56_7]